MGEQEETPPHITIVGGGIAGLSTAWYLEQKAAAAGIAIEYSLIEAGDYLGGKIITDHSAQDLLIEGGPDSFIIQKPEGRALCVELGLEDQLMPVNSRPVYVLYNHELHRIPAGFYLAVPANFKAFASSKLFSIGGKLRACMEPFIGPRKEKGDESLAAFIRRRVGVEILERIAAPLMAGIFVADPEKLSMQGAFPQFLEMEEKHGSLIKAIRARKKMAAKHTPSGGAASKGKRRPPSPFLTLRNGMSTLTNALKEKLTGELRAGTSVEALTQNDAGRHLVTLNDGTKLESDAVILACPAYNTADLVAPFLPELGEMLKSIRYLSTATVSLAFDRKELESTGAHHLDGLGFIVADKQSHDVLACTLSSNKFNYRAKDDALLMRFFVGGYAQEKLAELPDEELLFKVRLELKNILGIDVEPLTHRIYRWPKGNPQYDVGHLDRVADMEALAATVPGMFLTGSAYRGVGIPGCVANSKRTVDEVIQFLQTPTPQPIETT